MARIVKEMRGTDSRKRKYLSMLDPQIQNIHNDLVELSDPNLQRLLWKGLMADEISSYVELMCRLFDDDGLEDFIKTILLDQKFNHVWLAKLERITKELHDFNGEGLEIDALINSDRWRAICSLAKEVVDGWPFPVSP
jgi:hypothetical protein